MSGDLPGEIRLDAWTGTAAAHAALDERAGSWGALGALPASQQPLDLGRPADLTDWESADVGFGVLPGTVMLRWDPTVKDVSVRRYFPDGSTQTPNLLSGDGTGRGRLRATSPSSAGPTRCPGRCSTPWARCAPSSPTRWPAGSPTRS